MGRPFRRGQQPAVPWVDLVVLLELAGEQHPVEEFVREVSLALPVGGDPVLEHHLLQSSDGFFLGNAGVGDAVEVSGQQLLLIRRR